MYNRSYEQYMQDVLGYNTNSGVNTYPRNYYETYPDDMYNRNLANMYVQEQSEEDLEKYYPDIYRIVYPMVCKTCSQVTGPVTEEMIENMTNTIYMNLESEESLKVNMKVVQNRNGDVKNPNSKESELETRQQNFLLRDLIRILLLRELLRRRRPNRPPFPGPRPPFPGQRPPMPRSSYEEGLDYLY